MDLPRKSSRLPREVADGLYDPSFLPKELKLNEFLSDPDETRKNVQKSLEKKIRPATRPEAGDIDGATAPLTEAEAKEVDHYIEELKEGIAQTRGRISKIRNFIDETANPKDGQEFSLSLDISKKPTVRRAIQKVFGYKTDSLTYSMYKAAVELKRKLEDEESQAYVNGTTPAGIDGSRVNNFGTSSTEQENHV